jgi:hypothetical protein
MRRKVLSIRSREIAGVTCLDFFNQS